MSGIIRNGAEAESKTVSNDSLQPEVCAERLRALADPIRLRIVNALRSQEFSVSDLAILLESDTGIVSHHLQILKHAHLVAARKEGRFIYYSLPPNLYCSARTEARDYLDLGCCRLEIPQS